ncbi:helix-turn-helix domain-containing protein [Patescibacteria group bacterium]|nr:helix-turn-helix domain-containing protein [Patescibacteria group bacterium]MBU1721345.1 helix-turn-helix domain-containing protein [Patescibacteria group bacterium]MBU1901553.1 helix-turn-helix domain-containing protein [Patescibacteria group bacterium]
MNARTPFKEKHLPETKRIGSYLQDARMSKGVTLAEMSQQLRISKQHIQMIEESHFTELPFSIMYQKKILAYYAELIGVNPTDCVNQFIKEEGKTTKKNSPTLQKRWEYSSFISNLPLILRNAALTTIAFTVLGYLVLQVKHIVEPPILTIYSPENGQIINNADLHIYGQTDKQAQVQINGKTIVNNENGYFDETITLSQGVNSITFTAKKKHGKIISDTRHVVYKKEQTLSLQQ